MRRLRRSPTRSTRLTVERDRMILVALQHLGPAPRGAAPMGPSRAYFPLRGPGSECYAGRPRLRGKTGPAIAGSWRDSDRGTAGADAGDTHRGVPGLLRRAVRWLLPGEATGNPPGQPCRRVRTVGGVSLLLLKWTFLTAIPNEVRVCLLTVFPCLSRLGMLATMAAFAYARKEGTGTSFQEEPAVGRSPSAWLPQR